MLNTLITTVYAQEGDNSGAIMPTNIPTEIGPFIQWITNWIIAVGLGITVIMLALAFIGFATSRGDEEKTKNAQNWLTYAVIGGIGLFLVYVIRSIILNLVGVTLDQVPGGFTGGTE